MPFVCFYSLCFAFFFFFLFFLVRMVADLIGSKLCCDSINADKCDETETKLGNVISWTVSRVMRLATHPEAKDSTPPPTK